MRVSHSFPSISAVFDDPNLVSCAGLAPTLSLAQRAGLADLVSSTLTLKTEGGANAHLKVPALVVAGELVNEDEGDALAYFLVEKTDSVDTRSGHAPFIRQSSPSRQARICRASSATWVVIAVRCAPGTRRIRAPGAARRQARDEPTRTRRGSSAGQKMVTGPSNRPGR